MFCEHCGAKLEDTAKFCSACGKGTAPAPPPAEAPKAQSNAADEFDPADIAQNKVMAALSYLGILVLVPWFAAEKSKFARFHAKQGINLLLLYVAYGIVSALLSMIKTTQYFWGVPYKATPGFVVFIIWVLGIGLSVFAIIGIVNALSGKAAKLPLIGNLNLIK